MRALLKVFEKYDLGDKSTRMNTKRTSVSSKPITDVENGDYTKRKRLEYVS